MAPSLRGVVVHSAIGLFLASGLARADDLARWNVSQYQPANNGGPVTPLPTSAVLAHVTASPVTAGKGVQSLDPCGGPLALTACAGPADMWVQYFSPTFDPNDYFQFVIAPEAGYEITYQGMQIPMGILYVVDRVNPGAGRSTGPKTWELRYSLDGFATPGTTLWMDEPFPFSIPGLPGHVVGASEEVHLSMNISAVGTQSVPVTFRFYGYNVETAHPSGPQGFGGGPTNRTYFGQAQFDTAIFGSVSQGACYPNCDGSTAAPVLNINDFVCFQQRYAAGDPYANCDGSTTPPVLNINDFVCFQQQFAGGCR